MSSPAFVLPPQTKKEPAVVRSGDTVVWRREFRDYPSTDFSLTYAIVSATAQHIVAATVSDEYAGGFDIKIPSTDTATWTPGLYRWEAYVKNQDGERVTVDQGQLTVLVNLETATGGVDERDNDEKILDAIKALLLGKVLSGDALMYEIHGRKLQKHSYTELAALRSEYALRVRQNRIRRGESVSSRTVRVSFRG